MTALKNLWLLTITCALVVFVAYLIDDACQGPIHRFRHSVPPTQNVQRIDDPIILLPFASDDLAQQKGDQESILADLDLDDPDFSHCLAALSDVRSRNGVITVTGRGAIVEDVLANRAKSRLCYVPQDFLWDYLLYVLPLLNIVTLLVYAWDKRAATLNRAVTQASQNELDADEDGFFGEKKPATTVSRVPEIHLWTLGLFGGWPGGFVGRWLFSHKTKKVSFIIGFWVTVVINLAVLIWWYYFAKTLAATPIPDVRHRYSLEHPDSTWHRHLTLHFIDGSDPFDYDHPYIASQWTKAQQSTSGLNTIRSFFYVRTRDEPRVFLEILATWPANVEFADASWLRDELRMYTVTHKDWRDRNTLSREERLTPSHQRDLAKYLLKKCPQDGKLSYAWVVDTAHEFCQSPE